MNDERGPMTPAGTPYYAPPPPPPNDQSVRIPLSRPVLTYVLLGLIALMYVAESLLGGSTNSDTLVFLGAQVNQFVALGEYWRLLGAMFLHIGIMHLAFNGWALYSLGREVEAFYGTPRFTLIYLLSGFFGGMATFWLGPNVLSAGASGAIFGLVGAEIAYFFVNRKLFGQLSRRSLGNLAILVAINLVLGFSPGSGVNNYAHLGGLVGGLALGLGLAPRYALEWHDLSPVLRNRASRAIGGLAVLGVTLALLFGLEMGQRRWDAAGAGAATTGDEPVAGCTTDVADGASFWQVQSARW
jgi:rhomboid protease GluP